MTAVWGNAKKYRRGLGSGQIGRGPLAATRQKETFLVVRRPREDVATARWPRASRTSTRARMGVHWWPWVVTCGRSSADMNALTVNYPQLVVYTLA